MLGGRLTSRLTLNPARLSEGQRHRTILQASHNVSQGPLLDYQLESDDLVIVGPNVTDNLLGHLRFAYPEPIETTPDLQAAPMICISILEL